MQKRGEAQAPGGSDARLHTPVMSVCEATSRLSPTSHDPEAQASISFLPTEILVHVFSYLNPRSLVACIKTCRQWRTIINQTQVIWRIGCLQLQYSRDSVQKDIRAGLSWKETLQKNYGKNELKGQWRVGQYSNPHCYDELPDKQFCCLDTESWGQVLEWEQYRS